MTAVLIKIKNRIPRGMLHEMWLEAKWMYQYVKKYRGAILYYIILGIFSTGLGLAGSLASKYLIDVVTGHDASNLSFLIIIMVCMAMGNILVSAVTGRLSAKIGLKVVNEIQADVYQQILITDWEALSKYHSGDLLNRISNDVGLVANSVLGWIPNLISRTFQFVGALLIILYYDPTMAVIALLSSPVTLIMSRILVRRMRDFNMNMRETASEMLSFHEESLQNIQIIKSFNLITYFIERLKGLQQKFVSISMDYNKFSILTSSILSFVGSVVTYATFGWGVYRLWSGSITYGTMVLFLQLSGNLSGTFSALIGLIPSAISATTSAGRLMEVIQMPREKGIRLEEDDIIRTKAKRSEYELSVKLSHMDFGYVGRKNILNNVEFYTKDKEFIAIIGPSGEGKTTLLRILLGLLNPISGEAVIKTQSGMLMPINHETREYFSYVPQGSFLFSGSIADNLRMVRPEATEEEMIEALRAADAYEFIEPLKDGIHTIVGERGGTLSEGQGQRISIARALLKDAPILLFDEATSALDVETEKRVLYGIMKSGKNRTCILTTHRQSVLEFCHRIYKIEDSCVSELDLEEALQIAMD